MSRTPGGGRVLGRGDGESDGPGAQFNLLAQWTTQDQIYGKEQRMDDRSDL